MPASITANMRARGVIGVMSPVPQREEGLPAVIEEHSERDGLISKRTLLAHAELQQGVPRIRPMAQKTKAGSGKRARNIPGNFRASY